MSETENSTPSLKDIERAAARIVEVLMAFNSAVTAHDNAVRQAARVVRDAGHELERVATPFLEGLTKLSRELDEANRLEADRAAKAAIAKATP